MGNGVIPREKSIQIFFVYGGERMRKTLRASGKPLLPTPANLKYAERVAIEIRQRIAADAFVLSDYFPDDAKATVGVGRTVGAQLDAWLAAQRLAESTRKTYTSSIVFWKQAPATKDGAVIGDMQLRALRHSHVLTGLASRPGLSGKTVNNYVSVLREACQLAVLDKVLRDNPVQAIAKVAHQKEPPDPFDAHETELILADMAKHYDPQEVNYCEFKFFTGLRPGEAIALQWANVDLVKREILVRESVVLGVRKATKTDVARVVRLNSRSLAALQRQRQHTFMAGGAVFHDPRKGAAWADEKAWKKRCWVPCLKRLGIRWRPPYNTRHTYATQLLMADVKAARAAKWMGHSRQVFDSTYARWLDGARDDYEMEKLEMSMKHEQIGAANEG